MADFIKNANIYNIASEGELASMLSHFNPDYIFDVIKTNIANRGKYNTGIIQIPNIVTSYEQNFKNLKDTFRSDIASIEETRMMTYKQIINIICKEFNLYFSDTGEIDYYTAATYLYDIFVCNFNTYVIRFFVNYICTEKNAIYDMCDMNAQKKNKDSSTIYAKKLYNDPKIAIISSNLGAVIYNITGMDIPFEIIIKTVYPDPIVCNFILSIVSPVGDFYKEVYCSYIMNQELFPMNLTNIRLELQQRFVQQNLMSAT